jgi:predicted DNA-binding WGR domain protein
MRIRLELGTGKKARFWDVLVSGTTIATTTGTLGTKGRKSVVKAASRMAALATANQLAVAKRAEGYAEAKVEELRFTHEELEIDLEETRARYAELEAERAKNPEPPKPRPALHHAPERKIDWPKVASTFARIQKLSSTRVSRKAAVAADEPELVDKFGGRSDIETLELRFGKKNYAAMMAKDAAEGRRVLTTLTTKAPLAPSLSLARLIGWEIELQRKFIDNDAWPLPRGTFISFAAYGEGSELAFWARGDDCTAWPVVLIGGEGELAIVAPDVNTFLAVLRRAWQFDQMIAGTGFETPLTKDSGDIPIKTLQKRIAQSRAKLGGVLKKACGLSE